MIVPTSKKATVLLGVIVKFLWITVEDLTPDKKEAYGILGATVKLLF